MGRRTPLQKKDGQQLLFTATVGRFGRRLRYGREEETILLKRVRFDDGKLATDHLWLKAGTWTTGLESRHRIAFSARVKEYVKGYQGDDPERQAGPPMLRDYGLSRPTNVRIIID